MGNRVYLELHGGGAEPGACLACNNGLPLFWLALLRVPDLGGAWEAALHAAFADPEEGALPPLCLDWPDAAANLALACDRADARLPALAPLLRAWAAGLAELAARGPAREVRLSLAEHANFFETPDAFLRRLHEIVRIWHGTALPALPPFADPAQELTGYDWLTDRPFPTAPADRPALAQPADAPRLPPPAARAVGAAAEWAMVALFVAMVLGGALLGARLLGSAWAGGGLGVLAACLAVWQWARRATAAR